MKKYLLIFLSMFYFVTILSAQNVSDLSDPLYNDLQIWETRGIIDFLPLLRPYSLQFVQQQLEIVSKKGRPQDRRKATAYLKGIQTGIHPDISLGQTVSTDMDGLYSLSEASIGLNTFFMPEVSFSGSLSGVIEDQTEGEGLNPYYQRSEGDLARDDSAFTIKGRKILVSQAQSSLMSFGNSHLWGNIGLTRTGYGSFFNDSIVVSPTSDQTGHFSLTYVGRRFRYSGLLMTLTAVEDNRWGDAKFSTLFGNKFLATREFAFKIFPWAEMGYISNTIWGERFEPLYLIPISDLMYNQMVSGAQDNSQMGAFLNTQFGNWRWDSMVYVDDASLKDLLTFNLDTKLKVSLQTGVKWAPDKGPLKLAQLDYTAVTPYTYTHWIGTNSDSVGSNGDDYYVNYWNYTHNGENLATWLNPNSDRLHLSAIIEMTPDFSIKGMTQLFRHGNASAGYDGRSGTIFDDGIIMSGSEVKNKLFNSLNFLTQDVIETTFQAGFDLEYALQMSGKPVKLTGGYTFEYIWNKGLIKDKNALNNYLDLGWKIEF